ncbi:hypothetical protein [Streptomyces lunaelactis]|uniref:hypothetical protein n=1 Tax=Streptomyces lunaelactis TaxID=1535768 RepID=UPI001C3063B7|nr:hypothetical protein [Streptomyces lunaelactis]
MGNFEFTNLNQTERYVDKAVRIVELLDEHSTIKNYVGGRPVRITLHVRTTETPADVRDLGDDGVQINLASYYFEKYDIGYIMGMLAHEIGLHPLASRNTEIPEQEEAYRGMPLPVPGLTDLKTPRFMNTEGAGQADHIMAAYPRTIRHGIYRDIVIEMAKVLAQHARVGVTGAKSQDVTDLFDTYLMDLASIAVTSDYRMNAVKEPNYTAKVYNAYKEMLRAQLAENTALRDLLPSNKSLFGVARSFTQLATSIATNNRGDSIQQPVAPDQAGGNTGEVRPRLPEAGTGPAPQTAPSATSPTRGFPRDSRPRFVVRSGFDARRFSYQGKPVTDLTVRIAMRGTDGQATRVFDQLNAGVSEFLNDPDYRLPNGDRLHVTVEHVDPTDAPHLTVNLAGRDQAMNQTTWWSDAAPVQMVHELTHQLGLRDEYRDADSPHRPHILGSLLGDLDGATEDASLAPAGLRDRHMALLGALIGDVTPAPQQNGDQADQSWAAARSAAAAETRESIWVDPVSLPRSADGPAVTEVPAHMQQDSDTAPAAPEPVLRPFKLGNFEFTNLNQTERYVDKAVRIVELLDEHSTIKNYVGGRPVRITLHVRTTETPADVRDLGDDGVQINLASYYFEKYDIGYIMGMLAHEIGLHPLASRNTKIPEEEELYRGMPLLVPGLETLKTPRFMNTEGAGQEDHVMAAFPHTIRHGIYRDIVLEMAGVLAQHARVGVTGAKSQDVTDLIDTYLMDLASIAVTNDHRARAIRDPNYTARVYNTYKAQLAEHIAQDSPVRPLLPADKGRFGVLGDFAQLATSVGTNNRGDSIQQPVAPDQAGGNTGEARPRLPQTDTDTDTDTGTDRTATTGVPARMPQNPNTTPAAPEPVLIPFKSGNFEFTNLKHTNEGYRDKAVRIIELLRKHDTIRDYVGDRPVRITLHLRTTETPADVTDRGDAGVDINLASYYFEKYDIGYIMGMLAHEIGLHPLASRDTNIPDEEGMFAGVPLTVPGLTDLKTPRTMNTEGAGQADHIMAAFPSSTRHRIYRDIVLKMAGVLAEDARTGEEGAKPSDVTDLIDTYLMDLATIALTNDRRKDAAWEPRYTAKVYNAYKAQFAAQLAQDSRVRGLLPADKSWYNVTSNFLGLGSSVAFNNQGDSIQTSTPTPSGSDTGEARPRLPQGSTDAGLQSGPSGTSRPRGPRDNRPRFVVRSGFDARRFTYDGDPVTDLTVRIAIRGTDGQVSRVFGQLNAGVSEFLNVPGYRLPNGDLLHVTVEHVDPADAPHLTVDLAGRDQTMDQNTWWADADPVQMVHELTHQLGLRDEYRDADSPHRPHIPGSLLGDLNADPEDSSLAVAGLRGRHLALLGALIGDVTPQPEGGAEEDTEQTWDAVRTGTDPVLRESVWVDPVSLPRPSTDGTAVTEVPVRMPQDPNATSTAAAEPNLVPFKSGNFEFTNLKHTNERYRDKAVRIIELLRDHPTINEYIGNRPCRITLHLRTTETPADVRDRGDAGVDINLASYYFEKYDIGYIMGMLAHEIGLHPLASRNTEIPEQEEAYRGMPLPVPGLTDLRTPRFMNTEGAGQADHVMAAYPRTIRHGIYRDIVLKMADMLAEAAQAGVEGAKSKDVTDLIDCYLMDLASIAITSDYRMNAAKEPGNTGKVYNAYKALFAASMAEDSPARALLPADKGMFGVVRDFTQLATSLATNNRGDSIQQPMSTEEARPRLPQGTDSVQGTEESIQQALLGTPQLRGPRDSRPRFVVRSGFDARRFTHDGEPVTDLTVRLAIGGPEGQTTLVADQLDAGVRDFLNSPAYRLPNGDRLHVTVEHVAPSDSPHLTVDLAGRDRTMDQNTWWADADPVQMVHELTHQLGLRDEYRDADSPHRPHIPGSLLGDLNADPEDFSLVSSGLRGRHLALLGALIGDVTPQPEPSGQDGEQSWDAARTATDPVLRKSVWVDPVSLPRSADDGTAVIEVPARMPQDPNATPANAAAEPTLTPFKSGNFEFTNLKHTEEKYRDKAVRIIDVLRKHDTIRDYIGNRPCRITLHVRTTETPADVTDRGDAGVDINLASYYFEKYDIGYIMGMLAHEIGLHPLASRNTNIPDEEGMFAGMPLTVPGLADLKTPRMMNTEGAGQADHIMAAFPSSTRHRIYRDIVLDMAKVLAEDAQGGEEGAKPADVTDLIDTYLMDLATIALTNDRRRDAAWEPRYTAKVYNAYKAQFAAQLAQDSPVRGLLPADKSWYNVTSNFLGLGSSVAFNNQGDSIQTVSPVQAGTSAQADSVTGEARPRLPQGSTDTALQTQLPGTSQPRGPRDSRPRFVVRSGFDARRFTYDGDPVTDLTVRIAIRGTDGQASRVFDQLKSGVSEFLNVTGYRLPNGDLLHVSVELVTPSGSPHLTVDLANRDQTMDQNTWWADADPVQMVHELTHQLGLRDEYRDADSPHRPHVPGSLLGDLNADPEDSSPAVAGLRGRHLALLGALIGDVTPQPEGSAEDDSEQTWDAVRTGTDPVLREAIWVDPVSLPRPSTDRAEVAEVTEVTGVPARMPQGPNATPATAAEPDSGPFVMENFEFTNLKRSNERYRAKAVRMVDVLRDHPTIKAYVGGRPVRITLHVRTTETPADVRDLGEDGVQINLASYYFEKYDIGYIMGMLAHEIGLHPLASRNRDIPDEEEMFRGIPLPVPGLADLKTPRTMNTDNAGQADHIMAAFPSSTRHGIYRDIVLKMAEMLADFAQAHVPGAKLRDVTDLIDCYLMDLASIAITSDYRVNAAKEPGNTAKVYNAYKALFAARMAEDSPIRALLPADKGMFGVVRDFTSLAASVATNNRGDSIQPPTPTDDARPRLPQATDNSQQTEESIQQAPPATPQLRGPRDSRPRFVVRSGFDARRFSYQGEQVTDLTVRLAIRGPEGQTTLVADQLDAGVRDFLNSPAYRLPNGDRLHVTVEHVAPSDSPHLTVDLVGRDRAMDQSTWWADADPVQMVHELTHQLGLRDEYRDADSPHRPHIPGSLLGDLNAGPEDSSLAVAGLRGRHLALLSALIGDVDPQPQSKQDSEQGTERHTEQSWDAARTATEPVLRESVWVDPVSLPRPSDSGAAVTEGTEVPARMPQDPNATPTAPARAYVPFSSGNFEFTNLAHTNEKYRDKAIRIIDLLRKHDTIREYIGTRPCRITLHLRTTEPPADVRDRDDDGVDINLASYYFEKYDIGYITGMLAHEIGLHPLASRNTNIPDEEEMFQGVPLTVPGLADLSTPRTMNTEGAGQADHIMAAFPSSTRHRIYRDIVLGMAKILAEDAQAGEEGAKAQDVTDLIDCYLMDLASIALTNDHRTNAAKEPNYTARVYNAYKDLFQAQLAGATALQALQALLPSNKSMFGVMNDFRRIATHVAIGNSGDSIQQAGTT